MRTKSQVPPILIVAFNRPDHLHELIGQLRKIRPPVIYCSQDGPRDGNNTDKLRCKEVLKTWEEIDWKCTKKMLIRNKNLGCQKAVSEAITWFFSNEESGIILEDDCIPHQSFFKFCKVLLQKYENDTRIMHISGNNFFPTQSNSYRFSKYPHCWGWATWRRAWQHFDVELRDWPTLKQAKWIQSQFQNPISRFYWTKIFDAVYEKQIDSWAIPWVFTLWTQESLSILPNTNLVTNIGFGKESTHTPDSDSLLSRVPVGKLQFPLKYPTQVVRDYEKDLYDQYFVYEQRSFEQLWRRARRIFIHIFK